MPINIKRARQALNDRSVRPYDIYEPVRQATLGIGRCRPHKAACEGRLAVQLVADFGVWRNASAVGNHSKWAHSNSTGTQEILFVTSGQTDINARGEAASFSVIHLVLSAAADISNSRRRSTAGKSAIQTG